MFQSLAEGNIVDQLRTGVMPIYIYIYTPYTVSA